MYLLNLDAEDESRRGVADHTMNLGSAAAAFVSPMTGSNTVPIRKWEDVEGEGLGTENSGGGVGGAVAAPHLGGERSSTTSSCNAKLNEGETKVEYDDSDTDDELPLSRRRGYKRTPGPATVYENFVYGSEEEEIEGDAQLIKLEKGYARARCGRSGRLLYDVITADAFRRYRKRQRMGERIRGRREAHRVNPNIFNGEDEPEDEFIREVDKSLHSMDMLDDSLMPRLWHR